MATSTAGSGPPKSSDLLPLQNRCNDSKSPYVRSHSSNPTAWQLWSPETLALAKETNRLLFVSIGYSACHWCHVMAHESFADDRIAQLLNENFIPIKIDREERPDIDKVYMDFLQATSGGGGWPLNCFVTPDLEPIFGGTYWPGPGSQRNAHPGAGFEDILKKIALTWKEQEQRCRDSARQITEQLRQFAQEGTLSMSAKRDEDDQNDDDVDDLELELLEESYQHYAARFDKKNAGFGSAPKFPTPSHLSFLLRLGEWDGVVKDVIGEDSVENARDMVTKTLEAMAKGGIKDQVGHGFARYSVTKNWSLPHFEKMLYDNAQLLSLYLDAWLITRNPLFLDTVHDIATYLITSPMHSPTGGFHASEDADSAPSADSPEHKEGAFYVWSFTEFNDAIRDEHIASICAKHWNVLEAGNVSPAHDVQGELEGQNTLCVTTNVQSLAKDFGVSEKHISQAINTGRQRLLEWRDENRPRPHLDDKLLVSWNGLAISALARTAAALESTDAESASAYLNAAKSAADFVRRELYSTSSKTLTRVYRQGPGATQGFADDYAFLIAGLIDVYEATFDDLYLSWADDLQKTQNELFLDRQGGGYFGTAEGQSDVLIRSKDAMDNAEPSANGVSADNLFRLGALLEDEEYTTLAKKTVRAFGVEMDQHPGLFTGLMNATVCARLGVKPILISGPDESDDVKQALDILRSLPRPGSTIVRIGGTAKSDWLKKRNELVSSIRPEVEMVQVCEDKTCKLVKATELKELLKGTHL